jgi:RNA polymerase sigma-70 factor (ECF subfamily)
LYRIAVNTAIDMLRKEKHILPGEIEEMHLTDTDPGPEAMVTSFQRTEMVQEAVSTLPDASRAVLVLREFEGLSYKEISESLEIPVGTVMSRLSYARKLLRDKLEVNMYAYAEAENV